MDALHLFAENMAGNWKKFDSFCWYGQPDEDADKWGLWYYTNRDADLVMQSNADVIEKELESFCGEDAALERHNHYLRGWVGCVAFRCFDKEGNVTPVAKKVYELKCALNNYSLLDDEDYSRREYDAQCESIEDGIHWALRDEEFERPANLNADAVFSWMFNGMQSALYGGDRDGWVDEKDVEEALHLMFIEGECFQGLDYNSLWRFKDVCDDNLDACLENGSIDPKTHPEYDRLDEIAPEWFNWKQEQAGQLQFRQVR